MAVNGIFTYEDLYADKFQNYHRRFIPQVSSSFTSSQHLSVLNITTITTTTTTTTTTIVPTSYFSKLISSTEIESNIKLNKLANVIPFIYFYWLLVLLAIFLTLALIIIFICYCRNFFKNYKTHRESLSSFYQYRTTNQRAYPYNIYQSTASLSHSLSTPPCPSKSLECLNNQFHRQDLDITDSPQITRIYKYRNKSLSTFTSSTSYLPSSLQSRLSTRSFDSSLKVEQLYESQRVSMAVNDEPNENSSIIDIS
ncbi:unnamed protein product [Rotaria sordida]|uniref:Uncharacterized protein n=1 Tax=Rotaria sordida TaxID=392033 RepID=A0A813P0H4_9BILA|nr:unnamed protein product [Rotaria sordida]CAF0899601.1 unnamed protein product [Rotaria sordida]